MIWETHAIYMARNYISQYRSSSKEHPLPRCIDKLLDLCRYNLCRNLNNLTNIIENTVRQ